MNGASPLTIETSMLRFPQIRLQFPILGLTEETQWAQGVSFTVIGLFCYILFCSHHEGIPGPICFPFGRGQYTCMGLQMGYLNRPSVAYNLCHQDLNSLQLEMCHFWHYIDILNCPSEETVWAHLHTLKDYASAARQLPSIRSKTLPHLSSLGASSGLLRAKKYPQQSHIN